MKADGINCGRTERGVAAAGGWVRAQWFARRRLTTVKVVFAPRKPTARRRAAPDVSELPEPLARAGPGHPQCRFQAALGFSQMIRAA
jgi:hypothetical protein